MLILVEINDQRSEMDEALLTKKTGTEEYEDGTVNWVEYWLDGAQVHRSVHIALKGREYKMETGRIN